MSDIEETPQDLLPKTNEKSVLDSSEQVLDKLNPRQIESEDGKTYTIYTFLNDQDIPVEVLFYNPNQLPTVYDEVQGRQIVINGEAPEWRSEEEWEDFTLRIINSSANNEKRHLNYEDQIADVVSSGKGMIFVESRPKNILETATQLGIPLDQPLEEVRDDLEEYRLDSKALEMVDTIIAGNLVDDSGEISIDDNHEGEALFLLALSGNNEANRILKMRRQQIFRKDEEKQRNRRLEFLKQKKENKESGQESLKPEDLVAVHATKYLPKEEAERMEIPPTFQATNWKIPISTVHFALNHEVASHMYGSWEDVPYVVIAPLEDLMELNGKPEVINTVDTFWEVTPGSNLKLPKNSAIIRPEETLQGQIVTGIDSDEVYYKSSNLNPEDFSLLTKGLGDNAREIFNVDLVNSIKNSFSSNPIEGEIGLTEEQLKSLVEITGYGEGRINILDELQEREVEDVVSGIFDQVGLDIEEEHKEVVSKKIRNKARALIKRVAVEQKIMQMGYQVKPGGMWAWGGSWEVHRQTRALGAELEVPVTAHSGHVSDEVQEIAFKALKVLLDDSFEPRQRINTLEMARRDIREKYTFDMSENTRRMLYLCGIL